MYYELDEQFDIDINVFVRTPPTSGSGEGIGASGAWSQLIAPKSHCFNEKKLTTHGEGWEILESRGRDNQPEFEFSDYVPVRPDLPDVTLPTKMRVRAHAKSPGGVGNIGESGMSLIRIFGNYVKL